MSVNLLSLWCRKRLTQCNEFRNHFSANISNFSNLYWVQVYLITPIPVDSMYSFVPAMKKSNCLKGFSRPVISEKEVPGISPKLPQGFNAKIDASNRSAVWKNIQSAVLSTGCVLGVHFKLS